MNKWAHSPQIGQWQFACSHLHLHLEGCCSKTSITRLEVKSSYGHVLWAWSSAWGIPKATQTRPNHKLTKAPKGGIYIILVTGSSPATEQPHVSDSAATWSCDLSLHQWQGSSLSVLALWLIPNMVLCIAPILYVMLARGLFPFSNRSVHMFVCLCLLGPDL